MLQTRPFLDDRDSTRQESARCGHCAVVFLLFSQHQGGGGKGGKEMLATQSRELWHSQQRGFDC